MGKQTFKDSASGTVLARLIPASIIVAGLACLVFIGMLPKPEESVEVAPAKPVNVVVQEVVPIPSLPDTLELEGKVEPNLVVDVAAEVVGRVERYGERSSPNGLSGSTQLEEGDAIEAGAVVLYLNKDLLQAAYNQSQSQYEFNMRQYERIKTAHERKVATDVQLDEARTSLELSKATLAEVKARLDRTTVYAPISGVINQFAVEVGEYVLEGEACAQIVDNKTVKVVVDVPEAEIRYFAVGQEQQIYDRLDGEMNISGKITYVSEVANSDTRTTRVEIAVPNEERLLHSGQVVNVRMNRRDLAHAIMIPMEAIIPLEHGHMVYVVRDGKAHSIRDMEINIRFIRGKRILVTKGLTGGEKLIVQGQWMCGEGQPVEIFKDQPLDSTSKPASVPGNQEM